MNNMADNKQNQTDILNTIHISICIAEMSDAEHICTTFFNKHMLEVLGLNDCDYKDDPLIMDYMEDPVSCVHPADVQRVTDSLYHGYQKDFFSISDFRMRDANGNYLWARLKASLFSQEGNICRYYITLQEVGEEVRLHYEMTERLKLEQQLRTQADHANQMKSNFLSSVSHDMRTPLNAVLGYTDLALASSDPSERQEYLEKIAQSGSILKELINDTLDLSRIESGKMSLKTEAVNFYDVIQKIVMTVQPSMEKKNISFVLQVDEALKAVIYMDVLKMQEIILNILSNAAKFTPQHGTVRFTAEAVQVGDYDIHARMTIQDTGIGMSSEFMKRIYEPFSQERTVETANIEGSGLGLTIVKKIIDMMGGTIKVTSQIGKGTTFVIDLSLAVASEAANAYLIHSSSAPADLHNMRFLIIEDNSFNREIARKILEQQGAEIETAGNGREGVDLFAASEPGYFNAVLMDIRMPVMDGYEATKEIRSLPRSDARTVPIIAMSADAYPEDIQKSLDAGMNEHLAKPINVAVLAEVLHRNVNKE